MVALAIRTGIPVREWSNEPTEAIVTALAIIEEINKKG